MLITTTRSAPTTTSLVGKGRETMSAVRTAVTTLTEEEAGGRGGESLGTTAQKEEAEKRERGKATKRRVLSEGEACLALDLFRRLGRGSG